MAARLDFFSLALTLTLQKKKNWGYTRADTKNVHIFFSECHASTHVTLLYTGVTLSPLCKVLVHPKQGAEQAPTIVKIDPREKIGFIQSKF